ncbi:MAG: hypothetical protein A2487_07585 [Candidatus Raymondbacteria bacterium RifOxyC12_full_50_8]|uniref:Nitroreductase domain-containing protein n=1 Tax=Candidatus Raymondbacteria bacterium RIFOXYD12_FULL_49_13 TaxID=1817890 RepID=A0A1F7F6Q1_UNCRA|nr:MAG: hypothetical protein A2248_13365 [Candidatus Raymondbacteria bacterium RIFOXYA2_FULL_49_16]OGJ95397.1 MAG: hypothetical protein A2350_20950 [Candidatus Raymondbacteria bacterium RifOxyB12_full_50_8]OGJ99289.1 MAG: hypothetical protein A2487_07585 [Candidatus Raymondbacteria bacterium RifOxyC12_full_50_8]OGK02273.1 MAG: hypothetical protein A2519_16480 [Candidatus Raymondbacteria bacterium RIFOXYD12_FULL_49_13]OGP45113.1 MAG: hypothetical protein A2324_11990 [Candidatus Raymondbacteria b
MKPVPFVGHPVHAFISKRWSPRAFADKAIEKETILSLFEAARWAASAMNEQPWRFVYAQKKDAPRHAQLFACLTDRNKTWAGSAPLLVLTVVKTTMENGDPNRWALYDLGLAMGNFTLQATLPLQLRERELELQEREPLEALLL